MAERQEHPEDMVLAHDDDRGHDHHHHPEGVAEEPLDPANQSLADALRLSFWVLKGIMVFLIVVFLFSGVVMVDQREVVVLSRFGKLVGEPLKPGLHLAWPYPIDEQVPVSTSLRNQPVDAFWLRLSDKDKTKSLSEVSARAPGLDPAVDGALITGDHAIMHVLFDVDYQVEDQVRVRVDNLKPEEQVSDVMLFVNNVSDEENLLRSVIQNAAVAEAARTTADILWKDPRQLAQAIHVRAQKVLDEMETGILLTKVAAEQSYFPLQARDEFLGVSDAENQKRQLINEAESERTKKLLDVAGPASDQLRERIERLDQVQSDAERAEIIATIEEILVTQATGQAGGLIKFAQRDREKIVADTLANVARFDAILAEYRKSPELVTRRLRTTMLKELFDRSGVVKWWLPPGDKRLILSLNKDPEEIRQAERDRLKKKTDNR